MLDHEQQMLIVNAFWGAADTLRTGAETYRNAMETLQRPSSVYRPRLFIDGDQWCALYGHDLQEGVAGFGDTPEAAMLAFDKEWRTPARPNSNNLD